MELVRHPLTAIGVAGFVVLQVWELSRWLSHRAEVLWWTPRVDETAQVYMLATGKSLARLEEHDIAQIAAGAGCPEQIVQACLRDMERQ